MSTRSVKAVATTSMPFLYQTKTLCSTKPVRQLAINQLLSRQTQKQCLHISARSGLRATGSLKNDKPDEELASPSNPEEPALPARRFTVRKVILNSDKPDSQPTNPPNSKEQASSEEGFTIRKVAVSGQHNKLPAAEDVPWDSGSSISKRENMVSDPDEIEFDMGHDPFGQDPFEFDTEDLFAEDEGGPDFSIPSASAPGESTITLEERQAFEGIFSDIYARTLQSTQPAKSGIIEKKTPKINPQNAREHLASIMHGALGLPESTVFSNETRGVYKASLENYPRALRAAAAQALGLHAKPTDSPTWKPQLPRIKDTNRHTKFRAQERKRVEDAMLSAPTDIALWAIMEKEVFSLIPRLGFEEQKAAPASPVKTKRRKNKKEPQPATADEPQNLQPRLAPLDLTVYGPLYPWYLVRGLQILNQGFAKPSPLTRNVLPRIKSLGLVSHILGASTGFYNELMRVYWYTYDDFRGVYDLLAEMRDTGLEMDEETFSIVTDIVRLQARYVSPKRENIKRQMENSPIAQLWHMPQFAPEMFKRWQKHIAATLEMKRSKEEAQLEGMEHLRFR